MKIYLIDSFCRGIFFGNGHDLPSALVNGLAYLLKSPLRNVHCTSGHVPLFLGNQIHCIGRTVRHDPMEVGDGERRYLQRGTDECRGAGVDLALLLNQSKLEQQFNRTPCLRFGDRGDDLLGEPGVIPLELGVVHEFPNSKIIPVGVILVLLFVDLADVRCLAESNHAGEIAVLLTGCLCFCEPHEVLEILSLTAGMLELL